ncbi:hypothetical protein BV25DRAFT_1842989 [Artomyces pyxidatus]|uniref:Uncharacterized protein n=1 Tax=Artomyces pyxidatus TaxID=48021 RepID=A0ACB8SHR8_9AGAM|nr:hypothetical protein BV25DRAFT_1842989 [Artomyces pyxidatus]
MWFVRNSFTMNIIPSEFTGRATPSCNMDLAALPFWCHPSRLQTLSQSAPRVLQAMPAPAYDCDFLGEHLTSPHWSPALMDGIAADTRAMPQLAARLEVLIEKNAISQTGTDEDAPLSLAISHKNSSPFAEVQVLLEFTEYKLTVPVVLAHLHKFVIVVDSAMASSDVQSDFHHTNFISHIRLPQAPAATHDHQRPRNSTLNETRDDTRLAVPYSIPPSSTMQESGSNSFPLHILRELPTSQYNGSRLLIKYQLPTIETIIQLPELLSTEDSARTALALARAFCDEQRTRLRRAELVHWQILLQKKLWVDELFAAQRAIEDVIAKIGVLRHMILTAGLGSVLHEPSSL